MSVTQLKRVWWALNPPSVEKRGDALKFGILGAANSALVFPKLFFQDEF